DSGMSERDRGIRCNHAPACRLCGRSERSNLASLGSFRLCAGAASPRANAYSRHTCVSLSALFHHLSCSLRIRISGAGWGAPMHVVAREGESPQRSGDRSEDAMLVGVTDVGCRRSDVRKGTLPCPISDIWHLSSDYLNSLTSTK